MLLINLLFSFIILIYFLILLLPIFIKPFLLNYLKIINSILLPLYLYSINTSFNSSILYLNALINDVTFVPSYIMYSSFFINSSSVITSYNVLCKSSFSPANILLSSYIKDIY